MFKAVLQQAGLDSTVISFSTAPGPEAMDNSIGEKGSGKRAKGGTNSKGIVDRVQSSVGSAMIHFSSKFGAERCRHHFHGCQWDGTGLPVRATLEVLPSSETSSCSTLPKASKSSSRTLSAQAAVFKPVAVQSQFAEPLKIPADALAIQAPMARRESFQKQAITELSPNAPEFHPGASARAMTTALSEGQAAALKLRTASETSTDAGESSELEDDARGLGVFASVGMKLGPGSLLGGWLSQLPKSTLHPQRPGHPKT
jgi:hypothetical protein